MAVALQFVLASATAMLVPFLASLANPPTRSAKATICVFAKRVVHSGAISSLFCKMSPTRCGQFDMSFGSENTRSKSPPFSKPRSGGGRQLGFADFRRKSGGRTSEKNRHTIKRLPKNGFGPPPLSFHSLLFRISLVNFKQGISLVILVFSLSLFSKDFVGSAVRENPW